MFVERRPPYDDRPPYADLPRGGYDDRRMPPAGGFEERRPPMTDRRPLMDSGIGPGPRGPPSTYERGAASSDMFSRREASAKPL